MELIKCTRNIKKLILFGLIEPSKRSFSGDLVSQRPNMMDLHVFNQLQRRCPCCGLWWCSLHITPYKIMVLKHSQKHRDNL